VVRRCRHCVDRAKTRTITKNHRNDKTANDKSDVDTLSTVDCMNKIQIKTVQCLLHDIAMTGTRFEEVSVIIFLASASFTAA
jgi:hypothetical protein